MNTQNDISNDEKIYILELQYYLRVIEQDRHEYSDVPVDGFFGPQTAQAVRRFQQEAGLPETGDVDRETWDAIYAAYTALHTPLQAFPLLCIGRDGSVNLRPGDQSDCVYFLQLMLQTLHSRYGNLPPVDTPDGLYSENTAEAVRAVQKRSGLEETGITDRETWNAITGLYNQIL